MITQQQYNQIQECKATQKTKRDAMRMTGLDYTTIRTWWKVDQYPINADRSITIDEQSVIDHIQNNPKYAENYMYVFGLYLGNGYVNLQHKKYGVYKLRIEQNTKYPGLIEEHKQALQQLFPSNKANIFYSKTTNMATIFIQSKTIPTLFPSDYVGRKHTHSVILTPLQQQLSELYPIPLIKGLLHTDGCYFVAKQGNYEYPRFNFTNKSKDIIKIFCDCCDRLNILYTSNTCNKGDKADITTVTISQKESVDKLRLIVPPKH